MKEKDGRTCKQYYTRWKRKERNGKQGNVQEMLIMWGEGKCYTDEARAEGRVEMLGRL